MVQDQLGAKVCQGSDSFAELVDILACVDIELSERVTLITVTSLCLCLEFGSAEVYGQCGLRLLDDIGHEGVSYCLGWVAIVRHTIEHTILGRHAVASRVRRHVALSYPLSYSSLSPALSPFH